MSPFEIALIIIGIVCIIVSCFFVDHKNEETVNTELGSVTEQILHTHLQTANEQIASYMEQLRQDIFEKTEDEMDHISNQKIMQFHEYSDQVLSDIKKNHNEVLFLYQMLNDKEEELKSSLNKIKMSRVIKGEDGHSKTSNDHKETISRETHINENKQGTKEKRSVNSEKHYSKTIESLGKEEFSDHIKEILELSSQGLSVIEISKKLGLGQGEVKLVLDYNKR